MKKFNEQKKKRTDKPRKFLFGWVRVLSIGMTLVLSFTTVTLAWYSSNGLIISNPSTLSTADKEDFEIQIIIGNISLPVPHIVDVGRVGATIPRDEHLLKDNDYWYVPDKGGRLLVNQSVAFYEEVYLRVQYQDETMTVEENPVMISCNGWVDTGAEGVPSTNPQDIAAAAALQFSVLDLDSNTPMCQTPYHFGLGLLNEVTGIREYEVSDDLTNVPQLEITRSITRMLIVVWLDGAEYDGADIINGSLKLNIEFGMPELDLPEDSSGATSSSSSSSSSTSTSQAEPSSE